MHFALIAFPIQAAVSSALCCVLNFQHSQHFVSLLLFAGIIMVGLQIDLIVGFEGFGCLGCESASIYSCFWAMAHSHKCLNHTLYFVLMIKRSNFNYCYVLSFIVGNRIGLAAIVFLG